MKHFLTAGLFLALSSTSFSPAVAAHVNPVAVGVPVPPGPVNGVKALEGSCVEDALTGCLQNRRFQVTARYATTPEEVARGGQRANVIVLRNSDGTQNQKSVLFWFFDRENVELQVKVLDACIPSFGNKFWVMFSTLTSVEVRVEVADTVLSRGVSYAKDLGTFEPLRTDNSRFDCH